MEGMLELGSALRAERERQGRSLEEIYQATRITVRYLQHIERGEFEELPGEVYLKGFLRRYAQFLGLDGEALVRQYVERRAASLPDVAQTPPSHAPRVRSPHRSSGRPRGGSSGRPESQVAKVALVVIAVALAAVTTGWAVAIWSVRPPAPPKKASLPGSVPQPVVIPSSARGESPAAGEAPAASEPIRVSVRLTERCWFRVTGDGRPVYEGELPPGAESTWTAQERLTVKIGNPRGVVLTWNERPVELGGPEPVTRLFTPEGVATVAAPAVVAPTPPSPAAAPPTPAPPAPPSGTP